MGCAFLQGQGSTLTRLEKKEASRIFSDGLEINPVHISGHTPVTDSLLKKEDRVFILEQEEAVLGYMLGTSAKGRYDHFDYAVFYSPELEVVGVKVTVYRSTHGAAICQKKWLGQFKGYAGGDLAIGKEIDAISGASISAQSMVDDMQRCFTLMTSLKADGCFR
jgi:Na+-translocating ferredoxin:NAD+ oxidoreductase RnfG subunit